MKKLFSLVLALSMALALTACGGSADTDSTTTDDTTETTAKPVELYVFAAASMQESLDQVIEAYKAVAPEVAVVATYDSSGTLKTQIQEGADCDVFISAAPKQMNQLDAEGGEENTEGLDLVNSATRLDLLENKVTLAGPGAENAFSCTAVKVVEDVFSTIVLLRPEGAAPEAPLLRMELDKDNWQAVPDKDRLTVSVPPEAILLLES